MRRQGREAWILAGTASVYDRFWGVKGINLPPMFFKIAVHHKASDPAPTVLAFLFPHQRVVHGGVKRFPEYLVSVDLMEAMTGLDFFQGIEGEEAIEAEDTWVNWEG